MSGLDNPGAVRAVLSKHSITANKRYGQNFLTDRTVLDRIIEASKLTKKDACIEIGPGIGTLTRRLCRAAGFVTAVEIDQKLIPVLRDTLSGCENVEVICQDILKLDLCELLQKRQTEGCCRVVANLPYYITTPILMFLLESRAGIASVTVMVQKEVAERICSGPGRKEYGALSIAARYYAEPEIITEVPSSCFIPEPAVTSVVLHLTVRKEPPVSVESEELFFALIRASFNQRRKTLINGLKNAGGFGLSPLGLKEVIDALGKGPSVRGEELSIAEFAKLANLISGNTSHSDSFYRKR